MADNFLGQKQIELLEQHRGEGKKRLENTRTEWNLCLIAPQSTHIIMIFRANNILRLLPSKKRTEKNGRQLLRLETRCCIEVLHEFENYEKEKGQTKKEWKIIGNLCPVVPCYTVFRANDVLRLLHQQKKIWPTIFEVRNGLTLYIPEYWKRMVTFN